MIDFTFTEITRNGNIFCALFFFMVLALYWKRCATKVSLHNPRGTLLLFLLVFVFSVTSWYMGDFFGYMKIIGLYYTGIDSFHLEKVYEYIIELTGKNYILFRAVVWGGALTCFLFTARNYKLNTTLSLFILFLLFISIFSYARATLAMAIYYLGVSCYGKGLESHKLTYIILGVAVILSSYFFHKSMVVVILLTAFYYIPISRKNIPFIIICLGVMGLYIDQIMNSFMMSLTEIGDDQLVEKLDYLSEYDDTRKKILATWLGWIFIVWEYVPFYLTFIIISRIMIDNVKLIIPRSIVGLYRITFSLVLFSTAVLMFSSKSLTMSYRYLYMSFIPLSLLTIYLYTSGNMKYRSYRIILFVCGGYNIIYFLMKLL